MRLITLSNTRAHVLIVLCGLAIAASVCSENSHLSAVTLAHANEQETPAHNEITASPDFQNACVVFATGYARNSNNKLEPKFGNGIGACASQHKPLVFSVTHENNKNNHIGAANYDPNISSYMADFNSKDLGEWIKLNVDKSPSDSSVSMALDTVNFHKLNVTGWPLQFGHLFTGLADSSIVGTSLSDPIYVEFDIRIRAYEIRKELYSGYSGQRVLLGAQMKWPERAPRSNTVHFAEIDLVQADGYSESYNDPDRPLCKDASYDRCYYDPNGQYSEGRDVRYGKQFNKTVPKLNSEEWTHIQIPLSAVIHQLHWVSPPSSWNLAVLSGLYFAIESEGATRTWIEVKNYHVYTANHQEAN